MSDEIRYRGSFDTSRTEYCCGLFEAGSFNLQREHKKYVAPERWDRLAKTPEEAWKMALVQMRNSMNEFPLQMTLVVGNEETEMLRQLVNEQKDAFHVHTWTNPNSGNVLEMYVLTNGSKVYDFEEDE